MLKNYLNIALRNIRNKKFNLAYEHSGVLSEILELVREDEERLVHGEDQLEPIREGASISWQ